MARNSPNTYTFQDNYFELHIYSNKHGEFIALCDLDDYEKVRAIHWNVEFDGFNWYVRNRYKNIKLHRLIMNPSRDMIIDHINHNTLDNRKENLKICTSSENNKNRPLTINYPHSTNEYGIGVWKKKYKDKVYSYYKVQIQGYKHKVFKEMEKAIMYRDYLLELKKEARMEVK